MDGAAEAHDVVLEGSASCGRHDLRRGVTAEVLADLGCLEDEFAGGDED